MIATLSAVASKPAPVAAAGGRAVYRALHWGYFDAKILSVRPDGTLDLDILKPDGTTMMLLSRIVARPSKAECGKGEAYLGSLLG